MPTTQVYSLVSINEIKVSENFERSRKEFGSIEDLALSIERFGLMHPIIVTRELALVAGERRLRAMKKLHKTEVPVHFVDQLNEFELRAMELEENVQRLNMTWLEEANSVLDYHEHRAKGDADWTYELTADSLGMSEWMARGRIQVAREIRRGAADLAKCDNLSTALNILKRKAQREFDDEAEKFLASADEALVGVSKATAEEIHTHVLAPLEENLRPAGADIINKTFQEWLKEPTSIKYNVLHCDFPYGINIHKSGQIAPGQWEEEWYDDSADVFFQLCNALLESSDKILTTHAHIFFWYPTHKYTEIVKLFSQQFVVNPVPLIWFKSDSTGILPDPKRGPRRVYESALLMTRGDRTIVRAVNNCIDVAAARADAEHPSEKPAAVVHHFLRMLVDEHTDLLDPSCGGGSALSVAEVLHARHVTGIEPNSVHAETARKRLQRVRTGGI